MAERDPEIVAGNHPAYDADYAAWLRAQAEPLDARRFGELDLPNLVDEAEGLGRSDSHRFESATKVVLVHLLKWDVQTDRRTRSSAALIEEHRDRVADELKASPGYAARIAEAIPGAYRRARLKAHDETRMPLRSFPDTCPCSWNDIMTRPVVWDPAEQMKSIS